MSDSGSNNSAIPASDSANISNPGINAAFPDSAPPPQATDQAPEATVPRDAEAAPQDPAGQIDYSHSIPAGDEVARDQQPSLGAEGVDAIQSTDTEPAPELQAAPFEVFANQDYELPVIENLELTTALKKSLEDSAAVQINDSAPSANEEQSAQQKVATTQGFESYATIDQKIESIPTPEAPTSEQPIEQLIAAAPQVLTNAPEPPNDQEIISAVTPNFTNFEALQLNDLPTLPRALKAAVDAVAVEEEILRDPEIAALVQDIHDREAASPSQDQPSETALDDSQSQADEDEDECDIDPDTLDVMDGNHPLMARVQIAISKQLKEKLARLDLELREKEEQLTRAARKREDVGVSLYSRQQELARMQAQLEQSEDTAITIRQYREEAERNLKHTTSAYTEEIEKRKEMRNSIESHKDELEKLYRTLRQVDLYNEELRSKISVVKRTTLKSEEDIKKQEVEKKRQDYFIDNLVHQMRNLQDRRSSYEVQIGAQKRETNAAGTTLQEAFTEMEALQFEKRQLLHQWRSSLISIQRRNELLFKIETQIEQEKQRILTMENELGGFKRSLKSAAEEGERLNGLLKKLESEQEYLKRAITNISEQKEKLKESYTMYSKSLQVTEGELTKFSIERNTLKSELNAIVKATEHTASQTQKLEIEMSDFLQEQISIDKGVQIVKRDNNRVRSVIHVKESQIAHTQNELSNLRLEALNVETKLESLRERMKQIDDDFKSKNDIIEKYEVDIKRRNDDLTKKQSEMDLLNKKLDSLAGNNPEEHMGPLEATIHNLMKLIQDKESNCISSQQYWLKNQNELVLLSKKSSDVFEYMKDLKMRLSVLTRKRAVVNDQFDTEAKEIRDHQRNIRTIQNDMIKINTIITKQASVQAQLEENNLDLEQEFRARLKDSELESYRLEGQIMATKDEKERALHGLIEAERQIMLWEKKIHLAKETQTALDPNIGASEIREMNREIHRMKLRYASMLKLQEKMIFEMERSVDRRESIHSKVKGAKTKNASQMALQKVIKEMTKKLRQTINDIKECDKDANTLLSSQDRIGRHIEEAQDSVTSLTKREYELVDEWTAKHNQKQLDITQTVLCQKQAKRYDELRNGKYIYIVKDPTARPNEASKQRARIEKIDEVVRTLESVSSANVKKTLNPVHNMVETALRV